MRVELVNQRRLWFVFAVLAGILGPPFAVAAPALAVAAVVSRSIGPAIGAVLAGAAGVALVPAFVAAAHLSRARPGVIVESDALTIDHAGFFLRPLRLERSEVQSVYLQRLLPEQARPKFTGTWRQRIRAWGRLVDNSGYPARLPVSNLTAPDLSHVVETSHCDLLIVPARTLDMTKVVRRGLGALNAIMGRGGGHAGPTRATIARGFFAEVRDRTAARTALGSWVTEAQPPQELWAWLDGNATPSGA